MKSLADLIAHNRAAGISRTNLPMSSSADDSTAESGRIERSKGQQTMNSLPNPPANNGKRAARPRNTAPVEPPCPICGGIGYFMPDLPPGHPDFGKAVACKCKEQQRIKQRLQALKKVGTLELMERLTFDNFIPEPTHLSAQKAHNLRRAYETCLRYAQHPEGWLLLTGTYGCGKTHLAAAIAHARLALGEPVIFMVAPDLLDHLRSAFNPQSELSFDELFEQLCSTPLLILDDLGAQSSTQWAQEKLLQLFNHRYNAHLATVITTNQRLEELEPRLRSRFMDERLVDHIAIIAPDFRAGINPAQSDLSSLTDHRDLTFDTFQVRRNGLTGEEQLNLQRVCDACQSYAANPTGWLALWGVNGCGKTHLAAAIANEQLARGQYDVMLISVPELLNHLRAAFSPNAGTSYDRRFDDVKKIPLLVLDDLGTESATPWVREKLFQLFNYRYRAMLPTVITTNTPLEKMEPWLRTRLSDLSRCQYWEIMAPEYRSSRPPQPQRSTSSPKSARNDRTRSF
ncbi:MAG: AAA family ATPase [Caldilinea sp. CFX5]|nr:AAA family ATPase [Caldilinea sp. CFX5]